jgi:multiple sugar transport system permease protein
MHGGAGVGRPFRIADAALPAVVLVVFLAPLALVLLGSLRPTGTPPPTGIELVPDGATVANYTDLFGTPEVVRQLVNSLLVAVVAVPLGILVASWAGYAIARLPRGAAVPLIALTVVAATIPATSLFVGRLVLFRVAGLTDTPIPLIAPALLGISPLLVLLFGWGYHTIPAATYDLARESGLGPFRTWWHVALPLRVDVAVVAAAVAFIVSWGNLLDPLFFVYDERWFTLPLGLASLTELPPTDQGLMLAAAIVAIAPVCLVVVLVNRTLGALRW